MELALTEIVLPLNVEWKISRNSTSLKRNFIVTITDGKWQAQSEIAPNSRYGESAEIIQQEFLDFRMLALQGYEKALQQRDWKHSLRFALESAWIKLQALKAGKSLASYLGASEPCRIETSMSVPIMEPGEIAAYLRPLGRFSSLKIKVNQDLAWDLVKEVARVAPGKKLRIDGNEAFTDLGAYLAFEDKLKTLPIEFIEQPFPAAAKEMYRSLHHRTSFVIMADESIEDQDNLLELSEMFRAVNIKLMKTGSLIKGRDFLIKARQLGLKTMVGCMVETGLGISYALNLACWMDWADLDGFLLLKDDPFPLVREREGIVEFTQ